MPTHNVTLTFEAGESAKLSKTVSASQDSETNLDVTVPAETDDHQVAVEIDVSALESLFLLSDQDVTLETNDGSTPDDTFALKANEPVYWHKDSPLPNPFASGTDVTSLFLSNQNGAGVTADVKARILQDPTP